MFPDMFAGRFGIVSGWLVAATGLFAQHAFQFIRIYFSFHSDYGGRLWCFDSTGIAAVGPGLAGGMFTGVLLVGMFISD